MKIVIDCYSIGDFLSFTIWPLDVAEVTKVSCVNIYKKKNQISQFWSYRIQIQTKKYGSLLKNLKKIEFFHFWVKNEADQVSSMAIFSNFLITKFKNGFARSCEKV